MYYTKSKTPYLGKDMSMIRKFKPEDLNEVELHMTWEI